MLELLNIYCSITRANLKFAQLHLSSKFRHSKLKGLSSTSIVKQASITKLAFDTRYINQETDYNPRRNLQFYHRSEQFISEGNIEKIKSFLKLKSVLDQLKLEFGTTPAWQDSYARILYNQLSRAVENQGEHSDNQPNSANLEYLKELLYVRYRLTMEDLDKSPEELKEIILSKDEELKHPSIQIISPKDVEKNSYDTLLNKLFDGVRADKHNKNIERTITIKINDVWRGDAE